MAAPLAARAPGRPRHCTASGGPVQERNVRRALDDAKSIANLGDTDGRLSMHALRHAYCSALATAGLSPTTLARITDHSDPGFTLRIYARDGRDEAALVADVLAHAADAGFRS
ncbi:MAG: tyrosine-type recombinase/integrase [Actinomycetota bacterium]|nr:tyrosine-type recombinase/integrase [Actinomycetota bacterium]